MKEHPAAIHQSGIAAPPENTTPDYLKDLPKWAEMVRSMKEIIITNIVLTGQVPAPTYHEQERADLFMERLSELQIDECTTDDYNNPIGIIRGTSRRKPPIFIVAHMDTAFGRDVDHNFTIKKDTISGAGLLDNSLGVGVLTSLPAILRKLRLQFESDIVLCGALQSIGKGNLRGVRHLLKTWSTPIRAAICLESGELGRLNYYSDGMIRCEIRCIVDRSIQRAQRFLPNAILVINEVINQILELRLPLKPRTKVIFGKINGGLKHGEIALTATLGIEIRSNSDEMVGNLYNDIRDIVQGTGHDFEVDLKIKTISNVRASRLKYSHPLVKTAAAIMTTLGLHPMSGPSESELSIFLSRNVPALTLGITHGQGYQEKEAIMQIDPMFDGIAQVIGIMRAIDAGVCDE
jgi:acetylornithine deacetylase/succinyl-diaminopimelate desuccinylase-like protein